jgi:hypothetical protein
VIGQRGKIKPKEIMDRDAGRLHKIRPIKFAEIVVGRHVWPVERQCKCRQQAIYSGAIRKNRRT